MSLALAQNLTIVYYKTIPQNSLVRTSTRLQKETSEDNHPTYIIPKEKILFKSNLKKTKK